MSDLQTVSPHNLSVLPHAPPSSQTFDVVMGVYLPGVICVLGIVGNIVSLLVLSSDRGNYPTFMSLKALAASDVVLLFLALCQQVIPLFCVYIQCTNTFCRHLAYVRVYVWPMICITQMTSIWLTLLISAERYSAICRPLHAKRLQNKVRSAVVGIVLACVIYNTPRFFEFTPVVREGNLTFVVVGDTAMRRNMLYRYLYNTALYCLLVYIVPLCTLSFLNLNIMKQMRVAAHCWEQLNRQQQREVKATAIPLCIVVVFFVCGSQSLVSFILDAVFVDRYYEWIQIYTAVANLLVILNSALNFLIFYMFGSKFRKLLRHLLYCRLYQTTFSSPIFRKRFATGGYQPGPQSACLCPPQQLS